MQLGVPPAELHGVVHEPQWSVVVMSVSQPSLGSPLQSPHPVLHVPMAQVPATQVAAAFAKLH